MDGLVQKIDTGCVRFLVQRRQTETQLSPQCFNRLYGITKVIETKVYAQRFKFIIGGGFDNMRAVLFCRDEVRAGTG
jgi:hypothetical protein